LWRIFQIFDQLRSLAGGITLAAANVREREEAFGIFVRSL
jgi:hypothetical protein